MDTKFVPRSRTASISEKVRLKKFIEKDLKPKVLLLARMGRSFVDLKYAEKDFPGIKTLLRDRPELFIQEIQNSDYVVKNQKIFFPESCKLVECEKDATTRGFFGAPVSFNLDRLASYGRSPEELERALVSLAFHEHARNLGFKDDSHSLGRFAYKNKDWDDFRWDIWKNHKYLGHGLFHEQFLRVLFQYKSKGAELYFGNNSLNVGDRFFVIWYPDTGKVEICRYPILYTAWSLRPIETLRGFQSFQSMSRPNERVYRRYKRRVFSSSYNEDFLRIQGNTLSLYKTELSQSGELLSHRISLSAKNRVF